MDLNLFAIESELHGNLTLNTRSMQPGQDVYMGFIFKHAEPLEAALRADEEPDASADFEATRFSGFDGLRTKVSFAGTDFSKATFTVTDLWLDQESFPDLWSKGVLGDHLVSDPLAHDWVIVKEDSYMNCVNEHCQINVHFKRDFDTLDQRDHQLRNGEEEDFQFVAFYSTFARGRTQSPVHRGVSQPITIALYGMNALALGVSSLLSVALLF